ncbi:Na+/H+ antiporter NhaA [bacterium SCSIO 12696]|nr:Na+/H+ antiporter NhaA [bacterium SCSIO 12696]
MEDHQIVDAKPRKGRVYNAPWEQAFERVLTPFEEFIHRQTTSGVLLMICAVLALVIANTDWFVPYSQLLATKTGIAFGDGGMKMSVHHWVNDGLMAFFFFHVGLELKRGFLVGELSSVRQATLPVLAAIGGMVFPALVYVSLNPEGPGLDGWGIPMATDIAFAVGTCALLGGRVPKSLIAFLVALAIVDDLGAIAVIALFYTEDINQMALLLSLACVALLWFLNWWGIRRPLPYLVVGAALWIQLHEAGVHATLAGVITAFAVPAKPKYNPAAFSSQVKDLIRRFDGSYRPGENTLRNEHMRAYVRALGDGARLAEAPLQRIETSLHLPVTYIVIPIFALANAGIPLAGFAGETEIFNNITLGVALGLLVGKLIGIAGATWVGWKLGLGELPSGCNFLHIVGIGFLGGIGFTMSIFIAELAFEGAAGDLVLAKAGVIIASLIAGIAGFICLAKASPKKDHSETEDQAEQTTEAS